MKILLLSPWLPWPPYDGGRIRILETLRYLSRRHAVTLVAPICYEKEVEQAGVLKGFCEEIVTTRLSNGTGAILSRLSRGLIGRRPLIQSFYYDARLAERVRDLTSRRRHDIVQIEFPFLTPYLKALEPGSRAKKILTMHNIESLRFERELQLSQWGKRKMVLLGDYLFFRTWERAALRQYDGIVAVSDAERIWIQNQTPGAAVEIVPNGVDTEFFRPGSTVASEQHPYIVFTGAMDYPPNMDAAIWFCDEIWPTLRQKIPRLGFKIVGKNPHARIVDLGKRKGIHVTGTVADIRSYVANALALVVPLRSGGGTRLKILEAMAMERPVISTRVGAEGLDAAPGKDILIAEDAKEFIDHVDRLLISPELGRNLGTAGRRLVMEKYDWRICLDGLERLYGNLLGSAAA